MRDKSFHTVVGCLVVFSIVEPLFLRHCGSTRDGNLFCLPSYDCGDLGDYVSGALELLVKYGNHPDLTLPERGKYSALNTNPLNALGTIEFRTFPSSHDPIDVLRWADWCTNIIDRAEACKDDTFRSEIEAALEDPIGYAWSIFSNFHGVPRENTESLVIFGCETAHEIVAAYVEGQQITPPKKKKKTKSMYQEILDGAPVEQWLAD
jgi:hypothetical protein